LGIAGDEFDAAADDPVDAHGFQNQRLAAHLDLAMSSSVDDAQKMHSRLANEIA
jgi:hypothetical protein